MEGQYIIIITVLSIMCLLLLTGNIIQFSTNSDLHSEVRSADDKLKAKEKELFDRMQEVEAEKSSVRKTKEELFKIVLEFGDKKYINYFIKDVEFDKENYINYLLFI